MNASDKDFTGNVSGAGDQLRESGKTAMRAAEDMADSAKRKLNEVSDSVRDTAEDVKDAAADAMEDGRSRMGDALRKVQGTAHDARKALVAGAGSTLATVRDVAVEKADEARGSLSDVGQRLAATLERASSEGESDALKSRVLTSVAHGLTTASDALRQRSVADLTSDMKTLAKRHPGAFMAAAAVVGFAAARFVRSSRTRRLAEQDRDHGQGPRV